MVYFEYNDYSIVYTAKLGQCISPWDGKTHHEFGVEK